MFKFLRKYNKLILAVGGVMLMIAFLIPQAITRLSEQAGANRAAIATVGNGDKVSGSDLELVREEVLFMEKLGLGVPGLGGSMSQLKPEHWYLLVREANAAGLMSTPGAVQLTDDVVTQIMARTGQRNPDFVRSVFAKIAGVGQMIGLYQTGGLYSDRRLQNEAERLLYSVNVQMVALQGDKEYAALTPTEEEITAQMNKYADKLPGEGENGFGYKLPDRVKLEWLTISADSVRKIVEASDDYSTLKQRIHWKKNEPGNFPKVDPNLPIPEVVKTDLLTKLTKQKLDDIARDASEQLRLNRRGFAEKDGFVVVPADWDQHKLGFQQLAASLQTKFQIDLPGYESSGDRWRALTELSKLPGIGMATTDKFGSQPIDLTSLVKAAKDFAGNITYQIQKDIAGPPLRGSDSSVYLFRIIATDPSRKPTSIDEVRDAVVADLKREAHYKMLAGSADQLKQQAMTDGLVKFAVEHKTMMQPQQVYLANQMKVKYMADARRPVSVEPSRLLVVGVNREVVQKILDFARALPKDTLVELLPEEQRTMVLPVPEKLTVLVLQLTGESRLTRDDFVDLARNGAIQNLIASEEPNQKESVTDAFGYDAMVKRNHFTYHGQTEETEANADKSKPVPANSAANAG